MAKTPTTTVERFRLHVEASKDDMGHVMAEAIKRGLTNIGYELITDVETFRKNGARKTFETSAAEEIAKYVNDHPTFPISDVIAAFEAEGRTAGAVYSGIKTLVEKKILVKLGKGNYQRVDVKTLAPPTGGKTQTRTRPANKVQRYEISNKDVIIKQIKGRARFTIKELRDHFTNIRRTAASVSPIINKLFNAKVISRLEDGVYAWGNVKTKKVANKTPVAVRKKRDAQAAQASSVERTNG